MKITEIESSINQLNGIVFEEMIHALISRNYFFVEKLKMIRSSQLFIKDTLNCFDSINDFVELESIDTTLRIMMKSLGLNTPVEIFDLPF